MNNISFGNIIINRRKYNIYRLNNKPVSTELGVEVLTDLSMFCECRVSWLANAWWHIKAIFS